MTGQILEVREAVSLRYPMASILNDGHRWHLRETGKEVPAILSPLKEMSLQTFLGKNLRACCYKTVGRCSVTKSCLPLGSFMHCSPPGSSVLGISQARTLEWVAFPLPGIFPTQRSNSGLLHVFPWLSASLLSHLGSPSCGNTEVEYFGGWPILKKTSFLVTLPVQFTNKASSTWKNSEPIHVVAEMTWLEIWRNGAGQRQRTFSAVNFNL